MKTTIFTNPLLEAQEACKTAIETAGLEVIKIFNHLKEGGYINSFKYGMSPYNSGYTIEFKVDYNFSNENKEKLKSIQDTLLVNFLYGIHSISLSPESFYNSNLIERNSATITSRSINGYYESFVIKNDEDLDTMVREFVKINSDFVKEILS